MLKDFLILSYTDVSFQRNFNECSKYETKNSGKFHTRRKLSVKCTAFCEQNDKHYNYALNFISNYDSILMKVHKNN